MFVVSDAVAVTNEFVEVLTEVFDDHDAAPHQMTRRR
jgi:hypothetical protein